MSDKIPVEIKDDQKVQKAQNTTINQDTKDAIMGFGLCLLIAICGVVGALMLWYGIHDQETCKNDAANYLVAEGGFLVGLVILCCSIMCFSEVMRVFLIAVGLIAGLMIQFLGSLLIFGTYFERTTFNILALQFYGSCRFLCQMDL